MPRHAGFLPQKGERGTLKRPARRELLLKKQAAHLGGLLKKLMEKSALGELGSTTGGLQTVLAYSLAPVFLDITGFLGPALKYCPSI